MNVHQSGKCAAIKYKANRRNEGGSPIDLILLSILQSFRTGKAGRVGGCPLAPRQLQAEKLCN